MKKKALLSAILSLAICLCLIVGSTYALFTSTSELNVEVSSGIHPHQECRKHVKAIVEGDKIM